MRTVVTYTAILVGAYLALSYATGGGRLIAATTSAYTGAVRTLQGR